MTCIFRRPEDADREVIQNWIYADPDHRERILPEFFLDAEAMQLVIGDLRGPGLYVRMDAEQPDSVRLHIQFGPSFIRSARIMLGAWPTFQARIKASGLRKMVFESTSGTLIEFCQRCFGFQRAAGDNYELLLGE